ncbi:MAG TPA: hypothetical protein PKX58_03035 [Flexilinea sp.]|jgi:hypothetical protein|nr:hypothetical protein [Flexilinea sp.]HPJ65652.1 hypothetical protein [Flexilinea sp.]HPR69991.1 hypothetical protein [Flexilinea sp.]
MKIVCFVPAEVFGMVDKTEDGNFDRIAHSNNCMHHIADIEYIADIVIGTAADFPC